MKSSSLRWRVLLPLLPVAFVGLTAARADAALLASVVGSGNLTVSGPITIHYSGAKPYDDLIVQQCAKPDEPNYDWSLYCSGQTSRPVPILDKTEGDLTFDVFVGDEPSYGLGYSCGPTSMKASQVFDTCYLRIVQTDMADTESDVFLPITFAGAVPAPVLPQATAPLPSTVTVVSTNPAAGTTAPGPTTTDGRKVTVSVGAAPTKSSERSWLFLLSGLAALVAGAAVTATVIRVSRDRRVPRPSMTDRADAER